MKKFIPAIAGGSLSAFLFIYDQFGLSLIERFLLFAVFTFPPLVLLLLQFGDQSKLRRRLLALLTLLQLPAGLLTLASLLSSSVWGLHDSALPGGLSFGWLLFTLLLGLYGVLILKEKGKQPEELAIAAGLLFFVVGGIWFVLYQNQVVFFRVNPGVSALSAVHFHFSSAIIPIFIGMMGRVLPKKGWYNWVVGIDIAGPILIAFGIVFSKVVEMTGVTLFACNIFIYTAYLLIHLRRYGRSLAAWLLTISCAAFYCIVALSLLYPAVRRLYSLTIMDFIPVYGALHAFGFVLFGLVGWVMMMSRMASQGRTIHD